ncbi:MAG TPA: hypothetical protein VGS13_15800, partial [Stellaceae bacterium]|nr:hypothetical protein [Stellaceae bacterium]
TVSGGGGSLSVLSGGKTVGAIVSGGAVSGGGGTESVSAGGTASGTIVGSGGTEIVLSGGRASGGMINGGLFEVASGGTASGTVTFASGGTLQLDAGATFPGAIKGFGKPDLLDRIDLRGIPFGAGTTTKSFTVASKTSGTLTVSGGGQSVHLTLLGAYTTSSFKLASDGQGGTLVTDPLASGALQTTFADIAPAPLLATASYPGNSPDHLRGALAGSEKPHAGQTLLATGPPDGRLIGATGHHPWLPDSS